MELTGGPINHEIKKCLAFQVIHDLPAEIIHQGLGFFGLKQPAGSA